jgi:hypothetical protein
MMLFLFFPFSLFCYILPLLIYSNCVVYQLFLPNFSTTHFDKGRSIMPKDTYPIEYGKRTWKALVQVEKYGYEMPEVFTDFANFVLNALLSLTDNMKYGDFKEKLVDNRLTGRYEDRYMEIVRKYKENQTRKEGDRPADFFAEAWKWLQIETAQTQKDVLGHLYESQITLGRQGQFFTPHNIFRAIADMLSDKTPGEEHKIEKVHDPACGSGRSFIVMAQQNLDQQYHFVGIDISPLMARIAAINMWLFDLYADILQGNSLSMEMSCMWQIRPGGWIWESTIKTNGKPDGTVEAWLEEYVKNHPPMPEEERLAIIADYERWQKVLVFIREMEAQFRDTTTTEKEEQTTPSTQEKSPAPEIRQAVVVAEGYQRINNYQSPDEGDSSLTVAFVFPNEEDRETIAQTCSHYAHKQIWVIGLWQGSQEASYPAIITNEENADAFEQAIIARRGSVEPSGEPSGIVIETWKLPEQTATQEQAQLFSDLPPVKEKPARTKKKAQKQADPIQQQTLFE